MKSLKSLASILCRGFLLVFVAATALVVFQCPQVLAAEYAKVPDKDPTTIAANPFIAGAYGFIWVALLVYVVFVARGLQKASSEVKSLQRKLENQG